MQTKTAETTIKTKSNIKKIQEQQMYQHS